MMCTRDFGDSWNHEIEVVFPNVVTAHTFECIGREGNVLLKTLEGDQSGKV